DPVSFILVFVDHPQSSRIGNQNLMSQAFQESADPTGMGPRFQGDPHRFYVSEFALQGFGRRRNLSFFDHFSVAVQNHVVAFLVGQIQSNREMTLLLVITLHLASLLSFCTKQCVFADHYRYCVKGAGLLIPISAVKIWCFQRDPTGKDARRNVTAKMAVLLSAHPFGSILCRRHSTIGSLGSGEAATPGMAVPQIMLCCRYN